LEEQEGMEGKKVKKEGREKETEKGQLVNKT
jgi:hypothetical protein